MDTDKIREFIIGEIAHNEKIKGMFGNLLDNKIGVMIRYIDERLKAQNDEGLRKAFLDYSSGNLEYVKNTYESYIKTELRESLEKSLNKEINGEEFEPVYLEARDYLIEQGNVKRVVEEPEEVKLKTKGVSMGGEKFSDENLDKLADILSEMNNTEKSKLESLLHAKSMGIKKTKIIDRFSRKKVGETGKIREEEEDTSLGADGGILTKRIREMKLFDCGHPASMEEFGHEAECGHVMCKSCVERYGLVCAYPGCLKKLCVKNTCSKKMMFGRLHCKKHAYLAFFDSICFSVHDSIFRPKRK